MRDGVTITVTYQNFWRGKAWTFEIEPYCVKVFKQRWYMVAHSPSDDRVRIYSLDRIKSLVPAKNKFKLPETFDAQAYFYNSFGIIADEDHQPEMVDVKVFGLQTQYFRALPLHHSQQEISTTENSAVFRYFIKPTYDLRQELLSHGAEIEVLSP